MASFNIDEAKDLMRYIITTNRANTELGIPTRISAELIGDSGLGKTSAVIQVAEEMEMDFVKLNMSQIEEVGDLCGYPIKMFCITHEGKEKWVAQESLLPYYKRGWMPTDKRPQMSYAIPDWIAGRGESGILLLDDYSRADVRLLQATMELIDRGQYISWKLPKDWHIILTSNPDDGEFIVNTMDKAQRGRYLSATVHYDSNVWARWAEENHVDSRCINFMLMNDDVVRSEEDPSKGSDARAWTRFFYTIGHLKDFKSKESLQRIEQLGSMAVGSDLALSFATFINGDMDKIPEARKIIFSSDVRKTLAALKPVVSPDGQYRADIGSVIGTRVANHTTMVLEKKKKMKEGFTRQEMIENLGLIISSEVLGVDVSFSLAQTLMARHSSILSPMMADKNVRKYLMQ